MNNININYRAEKLHHKLHRHVRQHIHHMRQRPDNHKKIYAFLVAFIVTFVVFMLWYFLSLPKILYTYRINKIETSRLNESSIDKFKDIFKSKDENVSDINTNNIEIKE